MQLRLRSRKDGDLKIHVNYSFDRDKAENRYKIPSAGLYFTAVMSFRIGQIRCENSVLNLAFAPKERSANASQPTR